MTWIKTWKAKDGIYLQNCPPHFISQVSILFGFVPDGVVIESFFVPYYCDACGAEELVKVEAGHRDYSAMKIDDEIICPVCSALMHIDVVKDKFLAFWKKKSA
jgi:DNA-directed RNA polymerase subunit RPC12/RpoP